MRVWSCEESGMPEEDIDKLVAWLRKRAEQARHQIKDRGQLPGEREFRRAWFEQGPADVDTVIAALRRAQERDAALEEEAARLATRHEQLTAIVETGQVPNEQLGPEHEPLADELANLREAVSQRQEMVEEQQQRHQDALASHRARLRELEQERLETEHDTQRLRARTDQVARAATQQREELEGQQEIAEDLSRLLREARRQYGIGDSAQ